MSELAKLPSIPKIAAARRLETLARFTPTAPGELGCVFMLARERMAAEQHIATLGSLRETDIQKAELERARETGVRKVRSRRWWRTACALWRTTNC